jgi:hypothetical protein
MTDQPLSPAAQAVLDATWQEIDYVLLRHVQWAAAAALRAAADQVKHEFPLGPEYTEWDSGHDAGICRALNKFLAIAAELDDTSPHSQRPPLMFNSRPTLQSTLNYMTLSNDKMSLHLEVDKDTFWKLTTLAATDQQHVEEWLEAYLSEVVDSLLLNK